MFFFIFFVFFLNFLSFLFFSFLERVEARILKTVRLLETSVQQIGKKRKEKQENYALARFVHHMKG